MCLIELSKHRLSLIEGNTVKIKEWLLFRNNFSGFVHGYFYALYIDYDLKCLYYSVLTISLEDKNSVSLRNA